MKLRTLFYCVTLLITYACNDVSVKQSPIVALSTESLIFPNPEYGSSLVVSTVEIKNIGKADLLVSSVEVIENDDRVEITVLDADDWNAEVLTLAPEVGKNIQLQWNILDAIPDRATLIIELHYRGSMCRAKILDVRVAKLQFRSLIF